MKRYILAGISILAVLALPSCKDEQIEAVDPYADAVVPEVSISADSWFSDDCLATVTLTLDQPTTVDVNVELEAAEVQDGANEVYAFFRKKVRIPAGETVATVSVEADVEGYGSGTYQAAIKIAGTDWGTLRTQDPVYISISHIAVPVVNLYADDSFSQEGVAKLVVALDLTTTVDVTVDIAANSLDGMEVSLSSYTVVIPAGEMEADVVVTAVLPEATGYYGVEYTLSDPENAKLGVSEASMTFNYHKVFKCEIDGDFSEWDDPENAVSYLGEQMYHRAATVLKANADAEYLYLYFEFDDSKLTKKGIILDILLDADGDALTGGFFDHGMYDPYDLGLEWLGEFNMFNGSKAFCNFRDVDIFEYNASERADLYSNLKQHHGGLDSFGTGVYDEGTQSGRVEMRLSRSDFRIKGTSACVGVKLLDADGWKTCGYLPQGECESMSSANPHKFVPLLRVALPNFDI